MMNIINKADKLNRSPQAANPIDLACLFSLLVISNVMQNDAINNAKETGNAIWQAVLIACIVGGALTVLANLALRAFMDDEMRDWFTLTEQLSGPVGARVSAVALFILFLDTARMTVVSMETNASNEFLYQTPMPVVTGIFLLICAIAARKQMRGVVRSTRVLLIVSTIIIAMILLFAFNAYKPSRLFPIGGYGIDSTIRVGLRMGGDIFSDMLIICLVLPVQRGLSGTRKGTRLSLLMVVPFLILLGFCYAMAYPVNGSQYIIPPIQQLAVVSEFGRYIQRLSSLLIFLWGGAFLIGASSMLYGMSRSWAALIGAEDEQPLIWAFAALVFVISIFPFESIPFLLRGRISGYIRLLLFLAAVFPALLGRLAKRRKPHAA